MAETLATPGRRVKVYVLNAAGKWDDRGIGHVRVETDPDTKADLIKVTSDETGRVSLASTIRATHEALYQTQEDNIISWNEEIPAGVPTEVALSFQEPEGCRELWEKICQVDAELKRANALGTTIGSNRTSSGTNSHAESGQRTSSAPGADPLSSEANATSTGTDNLHYHTSPTDGVSLVDPNAPDAAHSRLFDDNLESAAWGNADAIDDVVFPDTAKVLFPGNSPASFAPTMGTDVASPSAFVMPEPDRAGMERLARIMSDQTMISMRPVREEIIAKVLTSDYITKICHLFRDAERESDLECLSMLYHVIRCLFVIGNSGVLEVLVSEKHLMDVVGCLEYDQEHIPELERQKLESKRKEEVKKSKSTSPRGETTGPRTDTSSAQRVADVLETRKLNQLSENNSPQGPIRGASAVTEETSPTEVGRPKGASREGDAQNILDKEKCSSHGGRKEEKLATTEQPSTFAAAAPTPAACALSEGPAEKNNSEETSSSGNMPDGEAPRFSLRTHRDYLERKVSYRSVVPINDQNVVAKIHQNYRVAYIRDVILSRVFDEGMSNMLSGVIVCNNVDIIRYFISGSNALQELFTRLQATVQNRRQIRDATVTSGEVPTEVLGEAEHAITRSTAKTSSGHDVVSTLGPGMVTDTRSDDHGTSSLKHGSRKETSSSSGQGCTPTSNPISLTTVDSCPTTDPNVLTSPDHSSRGVYDEAKKPLDYGSGDPKASEQSEELHEDLRNMLGLLRELCQVVKGQQPAVQARFHEMLLEFGALEISVGLLLDKDPVLRSLCCDILSTAVYHDQADVRAHIMKNATQQHSSVPKELIGSKKEISGATQIEGNAAVMETIGVMAEVTMDDTPLTTTSKKGANSSDATETELCDGDKTGSFKECKGPLQRNDKTVTSESQDEWKSNHFSSQRKDVAAVTFGNSESSDLAEHEEKATRRNTANAIEGRYNSPTSDDSKIKAPAKVSAPPVALQGSNEDDCGQGASFHSAMTGGKNPSRVETDLPLLSAMIEVICQDKESGVALTVLDLLRTLLDPLNMKPPVVDKSVFLNAFYEKFVFRLMVPIELTSHPDRRDAKNENVSEANISHICDLFSFCVKHHGFKCKYFVLGHDVGGKIVELLNHKRAHVRLSGVRFIRTCIDRRDDLYDRYIVEQKLMDPIMKMYSRNQRKDNLSSSAVLELVSFLTKEKREILLRHVIGEYASTLQPSRTTCGVLEEAKRTLEGIKQNEARIQEERQQKDPDHGNALRSRTGEAGVTEQQRSLYGKSDPFDESQGREGSFFGHLDEGDVSSPIMMHSAFRDGAIPGNARFGNSFQGPELRSTSEAEALYSRLTGTATAVTKGSSASHESKNTALGGVRPSESRTAGTPRGLMSKESPFKIGLRSLSNAFPSRGPMFMKPILPIELRSQAVPTKDTEKQKSQCMDAKQLSSDRGHLTLSKGQSDGLEFNDKDVIMTDEMPTPNEISARNSNNSSAQTRKVAPMKLSMSKSQPGDYAINAVCNGEILLSESSEDSRSPRKRERVISENSIEICSKDVAGQEGPEDDSPTKRRRVENEAQLDGKVEKSKKGASGFIESSTLECVSKVGNGTDIKADNTKVDSAQLNCSGNGQGNQEEQQ